MAGRRKKKNELGYPPWIMDALAILRPPEKLTVSEWADKYRVLSELDSASPGQWHTAKTPYLRAVMDAFNDDFIHEITFCAGTQLGKTAAEQNMIGYAVAQDPAPMLVVYPSEKLAKFTSEKRLQPMIKLSPALADKFDERGSKDLELSLGGMYIALVGANSPSELSSRPVRYIFFDEIDKFPKWTGAEAGPLELAAERTKTFYNRKIVKVSTPTLKTGNIWQGWETADIQYRYFVPCPHCGEMQTLEFRQIKWMDGADETEARMAAYYECRHCHETIDDRHKPAMLRMGEWRGEVKAKGRAHKVAYHLNSLYSPWLTFGDIAAKFISSKDEPALLMNFINSWLAEPWEDKRAWGAHMTSWLVDWGRVETWADLETVINRNYADMNGVVRNVNLACIDSGYNTDDVYTFCARHMDVLVPSKGSSLPMKSRYSVTILDKQAAGFGLRLYVMDTNQMKNFIASRMSIDAGAHGSWNVYKGIEREYADQICAEQRVEQKDKKGRVSVVWEKISSHAANHLLDCETNNALAAEIIGVRYLMEEEQENSSPEQEEKDNDWLGVGRQWI